MSRRQSESKPPASNGLESKRVIMRPGTTRLGWVAAFCGLLVGAAFLRYALMPAGSYDVWWHLATGRELVAQQSLLPVDQFSFRTEGRPWLYKDAFAELVLWRAYVLGGGAALVLLKAAAFGGMLVSLMGIGRLRGASWLALLAVLPLVTEAIAFRIVERPQTFSLLAAVVLVWLLERHRARRGSLWAVVPLVVLTANLHLGVWLLCPVLFGYAALRVFTRSRATGFSGAFRGEAGPLSVALLSLPCAMATPFGIHGLATSLQTLGETRYAQFLPEWQAVTLDTVLAASPVTLLLLALALMSVVAHGRRQDPWLLFLAILGLALGSRSVRFLPYLALLVSPLVLSGLARLGQKWPSSTQGALAVSLSSGGFVLALMSPLPAPLLDFQPRAYPQSALAFARETGIKGRVLNDLRYGGYLIFHEWPKRQISVDGRNAWIYTPDEFEESARVASDPELLERVVERDGIEWLLLANGTDDATRVHLDLDERWALVHVTEAALIYVRTEGVNAHIAREHGYQVLSPHAPRASLEAASKSGQHRIELASAEAQRMVNTDPKSYPANALLTLVYGTMGDQRVTSQLQRTRLLQASRGSLIQQMRASW